LKLKGKKIGENRKRNDIKHANLVRTEEQIIKKIDWEIRIRVMGCRKVV
jgi:hypothetical protein